MAVIDITVGTPFGKWMVVGVRVGIMLLVRCSCGRKKRVSGYNLLSGKSTGCKQCGSEGTRGVKRTYTQRLPSKHGKCETRTHRIWGNMKSRCYNANVDNYRHYGGRGITVCSRWRGENGFVNFLNDMGECPEKYSIERIDNDGNYCPPENCRWASQDDQVRNSRRNRRITFRGKTMCVTDWERSTGLPVRARLDKGWYVQDALTHPVCRSRWGNGSDRIDWQSDQAKEGFVGSVEYDAPEEKP